MPRRNIKTEIIKSWDIFLQEKKYTEALEFYLKDFENYKNKFQERPKLSKKEYFELQILFNKIVWCYWELEEKEKYIEYYFRSLQKDEINIFSDIFDASNEKFSNYSQNILKIKEDIFNNDNSYFNKLNYGFISTNFIEFWENLNIDDKIKLFEKSLKIKEEILDKNNTNLNKESILMTYGIFLNSLDKNEFIWNKVVEKYIEDYYNISQDNFENNINALSLLIFIKYFDINNRDTKYLQEKLFYINKKLELIEKSQTLEKNIFNQEHILGTIFDKTYILSLLKNDEEVYNTCIHAFWIIDKEVNNQNSILVNIDYLIQLFYDIFFKLDIENVENRKYFDKYIDWTFQLMNISDIYTWYYLRALLIVWDFYGRKGILDLSKEYLETAFSIIEKLTQDFIEKLQDDWEIDELKEYEKEECNFNKKDLVWLNENEILLLKKWLVRSFLNKSYIELVIPNLEKNKLYFYDILAKYNIKIKDDSESKRYDSIYLFLRIIHNLWIVYFNIKDFEKSINILEKWIQILKYKNIKNAWFDIFYQDLMNALYNCKKNIEFDNYLLDYKNNAITSELKEKIILIFTALQNFNNKNIEEWFKSFEIYKKKIWLDSILCSYKSEKVYQYYQEKNIDLWNFEEEFLYIIDENKERINKLKEKFSQFHNDLQKEYDSLVKYYFYLSEIFLFLWSKEKALTYKNLAEQNIKYSSSPNLLTMLSKTYNEIINVSKSEFEKLQEWNIKMIQRINSDISNKISEFSNTKTFESKEFENWNKWTKESLRLINIASLNEYISKIPDFEKREKAQNELVKYFDSHLEKKWLIDTRKDYADKLFKFLIIESIVLVLFILLWIYLSYIWDNENIIDFIQIFVSAWLLQIAWMVLVIVKYLFSNWDKKEN